MAFRFPLETVLRYRKELEKREERILEQRREALALLQVELENLNRSRVEVTAARAVLLRKGLLGDDLHHHEFQLQQMDNLRADLAERIASAQAAYQEQMSSFLVARQKREILEELRNSQKNSYFEQQNRREQQKIDEIFSLRFSREK